MKVRLHNPAIFHGALLVQRCAQAIHKRALHLGLNLLRVDRMATVGGRHDAVNLQGAFFADRHLCTSGHVAAKAMGLRQATEHTLLGRFVPSHMFGNCIQNREMFGMVGHQLAAQGQRVLPGGMGDFVDE